FPSWVQKCCKNHYSRDCQVCPGGLEAPCGNHGTCDDGVLGSGSCTCFRGFRGKACELCIRGYYGPNCTACVCGEHGRCDDGVEGSGECVCRPGWEGERCQIDIAPDLCSEYNGGCHLNADCNQTDLQVNCTCHSGYQGDGYSCEPINRCVEETNGGCSDFASCKFTGPNERECECLPGYVGNGIQCLQKVVPPVDRCLEANGGCAAVASCKDLHYHENTAGVFHLRSPEGKYKMNFSRAAASCQEEDATLATVQQLGDAQQLGMHLCVAGWLDGGKVGYPTRFPSVRCGDNHVGLVMYKDPVDQSNPYDAYCYRLRGTGAAHLLTPVHYLFNTSLTPVHRLLTTYLWLQWSRRCCHGDRGHTENRWLPCHTCHLQVSHHASRGHAHSSSAVSAILVSVFLACLLAALGYYVYKHKTDAFRFHYFRVRHRHTWTLDTPEHLWTWFQT
uniref:Stabilin 1 n=1 Tax=Amphiprion percula TaxID=161767 RepID=A0A3P8U854_AMPPE